PPAPMATDPRARGSRFLTPHLDRSRTSRPPIRVPRFLPQRLQPSTVLSHSTALTMPATRTGFPRQCGPPCAVGSPRRTVLQGHFECESTVRTELSVRGPAAT